MLEAYRLPTVTSTPLIPRCSLRIDVLQTVLAHHFPDQYPVSKLYTIAISTLPAILLLSSCVTASLL